MKILAFTDIHSNKKLIEGIIKKSKSKKPQLLICCGDITLFGSNLEKILSKLNKIKIPLLIIPGNHDDRDLIRKVFPECVENSTGPINFSMSTNSWQLIGIDTHVPGELFGIVTTQTIKWLKNLLEQNKSKPTIIFQHHPPIPVQTKWVDMLGLKNSSDYVELLKNNPQIHIVSCGHVHQEFSGKLENISVFTSPSTGLQFKKYTDMLECDPLPPGFRTFCLNDNDWNSQVIRLDNLKFNPSDN